MWAVAAWFEVVQREAWRRKFGTEFTGLHEGRPVRLTWAERVVGHICQGDDGHGGHLHCIQMTLPAWVWMKKSRGA